MENIKTGETKIFTDGSADPKFNIGGWVALIINGNQEIILKGEAREVTHQQMELQAVISALEYLVSQYSNFTSCVIYTDSQYVEGLPARKRHLQNNNFRSKKGHLLANAAMVQKFFAIADQLTIEIKKVPAHQKSNTGNDENRRVDKMARKIVRDLKHKIQSNN